MGGGLNCYILLFIMPHRPRGPLPVFHRPHSNQQQFVKNMHSSKSLELPNIYSKSVKMLIPEISLQNPSGVRNELSKVISFKKQKLACLLPDVTDKLPEDIKSISYNCQAYLQKLALANRIFGCCDLVMKEKDILVGEGRRSQASYIFITNFGYHPRSLCCDETVIIRCIEKQGLEHQDQKTKALRKCHLYCLGCKKVILKILQQQNRGEMTGSHDKKKKLLDFALHIASGRYKRSRMQNDSLNERPVRLRSKLDSLALRKRQQIETSLQ